MTSLGAATTPTRTMTAGGFEAMLRAQGVSLEPGAPLVWKQNTRFFHDAKARFNFRAFFTGFSYYKNVLTPGEVARIRQGDYGVLEEAEERRHKVYRVFFMPFACTKTVWYGTISTLVADTDYCPREYALLANGKAACEHHYVTGRWE